MDAINRFLSPSVVSVEPHDFEGFPATANGIDAVRKKNDWWCSTFEVNGSEVDGPYVNGDQFAVKYRFDTTNRKTGARRRDTEIAVYTVKDGRSSRNGSSATRRRADRGLERAGNAARPATAG